MTTFNLNEAERLASILDVPMFADDLAVKESASQLRAAIAEVKRLNDEVFMLSKEVSRESRLRMMLPEILSKHEAYLDENRKLDNESRAEWLKGAEDAH